MTGLAGLGPKAEEGSGEDRNKQMVFLKDRKFVHHMTVNF